MQKSAFMTQEEVAEELHISTRSLATYEINETQVPEDAVINMVEIYKSKALAFYYLKKQNQVGKLFLPEFKVTDLASAVVRLKKEINYVQAMERKLFEIACDGKVSEDEQIDCEAMQQELVESAVAALVLSFI